MSTMRPTICEAILQIAQIEVAVSTARAVIEGDSGLTVRPDHRTRWIGYGWPVCALPGRCDDCGHFLHPDRDNGAAGFGYDARWLTANAARRDLRKMWLTDPRRACSRCFALVAPTIAEARAIHHSRLIIRQIEKETRRATAA